MRSYPDKSLTVWLAADRAASYTRVTDTWASVRNVNVQEVRVATGDIVDLEAGKWTVHEPPKGPKSR